MDALSARAPAGVEFLRHDEVQGRLGHALPFGDDLRQGFALGRVGEIGWAWFGVHRIHPWMDGDDLCLDDDLAEITSGMEVLLDQASDEITEAARTAWPDKTFPKPHARVDGVVLRMWFGHEADPTLELPEIDLRSLVMRD